MAISKWRQRKEKRLILLSLLCASVRCDILKDPSRHDDEWFYKQSIAYTTLAGNLRPFIKRLLIPRKELKTLWDSISSKGHIEDMILMAFLGWMTVPFINFVHTMFSSRQKGELTNQQSRTPVFSSQQRNDFKSTKLYLVSDHVQQFAKIALAVYAVDVFKIFLSGMGFQSCQMRNFPHAFAQLAYTVWLAERLAVGKKTLLRDYISKHPETYGRMQIANRLLNAFIIASTAFIILSILQIQMGVAVNSFLAVGSVGTLALGLASQGITTQVLNGLMLASSDRIYEGDVVRFANGLSGTIVQIGWMETVIRTHDEYEVCVPHTDLIKQQVSNLSRVRYSHVHQTLRFRYEDADKIKGVISSIKNEICADCPSLITDGSRPFRVYWSNYGPEALEVTVEGHFRLRILSDEYYENRERVLMAIRRAVKRHDLRFAQE